MKKILLIILFAVCIFPQKPYVIMVSFDGFRWDYPNRGVTPNFDKLDSAGVHSLSLRPSFPSKTFPNHYSIITGMYPENHGIISNEFKNPQTGEYYSLGRREAVRNDKWYRGEAFWETLKKNGIKSASFFWPGSEVDNPERRPDYFKYYDKTIPFQNRIDTVFKWLNYTIERRPRFCTLYFEETDDTGHWRGPDSYEIFKSINKMDSILGYIQQKIKNSNLADSINLIVLSDHGMTGVSIEKSINIEEYIQGFNAGITGDGPVMLIDVPEEKKELVFRALKQNESNFRVYKKEDMPDFYHYNKSIMIPGIIVIAEPGWSLINNNIKNYEGLRIKGNHGFDNNFIDMHGIFYAAGPSFKSNYKTGTLRNIDIYPLLCKIFGVNPAESIDGNIENIEFILK